MKYKIVRAMNSIDSLMSKVEKEIEEGWIPTGGVSSVVVRQQNRYSGSQLMSTENSIEYTQAMIKG